MALQKRWRDPFEDRDFERESAIAVKRKVAAPTSNHQRTAAQQATHSPGAYRIAKKLKLESSPSTRDNDTPSMPRKCSDCNRLHAAGLSKDGKFLAVQKELISLKEALNTKDATILKTKHKLWENDATSKATLAAAETGLQEHKAKLTQKNKLINQLQIDNTELKTTIRALQAKLSRADSPMHQTHSPPSRPANTSSNSTDNAHRPPARSPPRTVPVPLADAQPPRFYPPGTGRLSPEAYGGNANWDLELCQVHFDTPDECKHGRACEYRHAALTALEREYVKRLGEAGRGFLERAAVMTMDKEG